MSSIMELLRKHDGGRLVEHLEAEVEQVVHAVRATGKKGSVTLKLEVDPANREVTRVDVRPSVKAAVPRKDLVAEDYYIGKDMELTKRDPLQPSLFLQAEEASARPPAEAGAEFGIIDSPSAGTDRGADEGGDA